MSEDASMEISGRPEWDAARKAMDAWLKSLDTPDEDTP